MNTARTAHTITASHEDVSLPESEATAALQGWHHGFTAFSVCQDVIFPAVTRNIFTLAYIIYIMGKCWCLGWSSFDVIGFWILGITFMKKMAVFWVVVTYSW
jgi:hypothetical protein